MIEVTTKTELHTPVSAPVPLSPVRFPTLSLQSCRVACRVALSSVMPARTSVPVLPRSLRAAATSSSTLMTPPSTPAPRSRYDPDRDDREHTHPWLPSNTSPGDRVVVSTCMPPPHLACSAARATLHARARRGAITWPAPPRALPSRGWRCPPTSSP